jgi:hypothetical protein
MAYDVIPLHAAFGQDEANHDTVRYPVDRHGLVRVPLEAVGPLTAIGGFAFAQPASDAISAGAVTLHHDSAAGCSYRGLQYCADARGNVVVPAEAAIELSAHGFLPVFETATPVWGGATLPHADCSTRG